MTDIQKLLNLEQMLNEQNILTKLGHLCCGTCASSDLYQNMSDTDIGIAWSHQQDIGGLLSNGDMYIGYASHDENDTLKIANTIMCIAKELDLNPVWDGELSIRIKVYANIDEDEAIDYLKYEVENDDFYIDDEIVD